MRFEWNAEKEAANRAKHRLSFEEAAALFASDADVLEVHDEPHSAEEDRFIAIGPAKRGLIVVVYVAPRDDVIRIVSARRATKREARRYRAYWRDHER